MTRFKLIIEYDGGPFCGWQRQATGPSIQQRLEEAVARIVQEHPVVQGAGRTDAGVHASGQVAHVDIGKPIAPEKLRDALNFHLRPDPIAILDCAPVPADFHARFSALSRSYVYRILNRRAPPALLAGRVWAVERPLDAGAMAEAAALLIGRHDFSTFRASLCQAASPIKTLDRLDVRREGEIVEISAAARSFLHHQVRNMTGALKWVGEGRWSLADFAAAFAAKDRRRGGPTAPAAGLCLTGVFYPPALTGTP